MSDNQASDNSLTESEPLRRLSPRYVKFAEARIDGANQTQAAIAAGYSVHSAASQGSVLARNPRIQAYIDKRIDDLDTASMLSRERLVAFQYEVALEARKARRYGEATGAAKEAATLLGYHQDVAPKDDAIETLKELRESIYRTTHPDGTQTEVTERRATVRERQQSMDIGD